MEQRQKHSPRPPGVRILMGETTCKQDIYLVPVRYIQIIRGNTSGKSLAMRDITHIPLHRSVRFELTLEGCEKGGHFQAWKTASEKVEARRWGNSKKSSVAGF